MPTQVLAKLNGDEEKEAEVFPGPGGDIDDLLEAETETSVARSDEPGKEEVEEHEVAQMDNMEDGDGVEEDNFEATQCPESFDELAEELDQREHELEYNPDNDENHSNQTELEVRCPSSTSNASDNLLEAALDDPDDDFTGADVLQRNNSAASDASDNLLEAAAQESEEEDETDKTRLVDEDGTGEDQQREKSFTTEGDDTNILKVRENQETCESAPSVNDLVESTGEDPHDKPRGEGCLSKTTLGSISMVESSQPTHTLQKAVSSMRNRTDYASLTMDQTEVVDSEILSAEEDESRLYAAGSPPVSSAGGTYNTTNDVHDGDPADVAVEVPADVSTIQGSPIIRKSRPGAHSQSLQIGSNSSCLSQQIKPKENCSLPLVLDPQGSCLLQDEKSNNLLIMETSADESPVFRRRQGGGRETLLKKTLSRGEMSLVNGDPEGCLAADALTTNACDDPVPVDCDLPNQAENAPALKYNTDSQQLNISVVRRSSSMLIEKHDDKDPVETSSPVRCVIATSVITVRVSYQ